MTLDAYLELLPRYAELQQVEARARGRPPRSRRAPTCEPHGFPTATRSSSTRRCRSSRHRESTRLRAFAPRFREHCAELDATSACRPPSSTTTCTATTSTRTQPARGSSTGATRRSAHPLLLVRRRCSGTRRGSGTERDAATPTSSHGATQRRARDLAIRMSWFAYAIGLLRDGLFGVEFASVLREALAQVDNGRLTPVGVRHPSARARRPGSRGRSSSGTRRSAARLVRLAPQPLALLALGGARPRGEDLVLHLQLDVRVLLEVPVPAGMLRGAALRRDDHVAVAVLRVDQRRRARLAVFRPWSSAGGSSSLRARRGRPRRPSRDSRRTCSSPNRFSASLIPVSFHEQQRGLLERTRLVPFAFLPLDRLPARRAPPRRRASADRRGRRARRSSCRDAASWPPITPSSVTSDTWNVSPRATRECVNPLEPKCSISRERELDDTHRDTLAACPDAPRYCYRHPDRETGLSCSECGRPICYECMTPGARRAALPRALRQAAGRSRRCTRAGAARCDRLGAASNAVTMALIAINVAVYLAELVERRQHGRDNNTIFNHGVALREPLRRRHGADWVARLHRGVPALRAVPPRR